MLLPSQLHEISRRYPEYVGEMREFLLHEGLPVNSPGALAELSGRLQQEARFRSDVSSLTRAVVYREREQIGYMELLGIVVVAAAGTRGASDGQDEAMRQTLRFLMEARRPLHGDRGEAAEAVEAAEAEAAPVRVAAAPSRSPAQVRVPGAEMAALPVVNETREQPRRAFAPAMPSFAEAEAEAPWWRTHAVWVVGFLGVLLGLGAGLMIRRTNSAAGSGAVASTAAAAPVSNAMSPAARRTRGFGRTRTLPSKKPSPAMPGASQGVRVAARETDAATARDAAAHDVAASAQPMETGGGRRPQPIVAAAQGHVTDRSTLLAEFAHPAARSAVASPVAAAPANTPTGSAGLSTPREGVVRSGSAGIMAGNVWFSPTPMYPAAAAAAGVQGEVTVRAVVGRDGDVVDARVVSGPPLLRDAALQAVEQWRYAPYMQDGKPVAVATTAIVDFQMPK